MMMKTVWSWKAWRSPLILPGNLPKESRQTAVAFDVIPASQPETPNQVINYIIYVFNFTTSQG